MVERHPQGASGKRGGVDRREYSRRAGSTPARVILARANGNPILARANGAGSSVGRAMQNMSLLVTVVRSHPGSIVRIAN